MQRRPACGVVEQPAEVRQARRGARRQHARRNRIDANARPAEFGRQVPHARFERGLDRPHHPVVRDDLLRAEIAHRHQAPAARHQRLGEPRHPDERMARRIHRQREAFRRTVDHAALQIGLRCIRHRMQHEVERAPLHRDRVEHRRHLVGAPDVERHPDRRVELREQRLDVRQGLVRLPGHRERGARPAKRACTSPRDALFVRDADDEPPLVSQRHVASLVDPRGPSAAPRSIARCRAIPSPACASP